MLFFYAYVFPRVLHFKYKPKAAPASTPAFLKTSVRVVSIYITLLFVVYHTTLKLLPSTRAWYTLTSKLLQIKIYLVSREIIQRLIGAGARVATAFQPIAEERSVANVNSNCFLSAVPAPCSECNIMKDTCARPITIGVKRYFFGTADHHETALSASKARTAKDRILQPQEPHQMKRTLPTQFALSHILGKIGVSRQSLYHP